MVVRRPAFCSDHHTTPSHPAFIRLIMPPEVIWCALRSSTLTWSDQVYSVGSTSHFPAMDDPMATAVDISDSAAAVRHADTAMPHGLAVTMCVVSA